jgi:gliding motility-associated lipoprotein GldD
MKYLIQIALIATLLISCGDDAFTPKPRGYPRVIYPAKEYQAFDANYCAFTFQYPKYAEVQQDTSFFDEQPAHPCWFNIHIPAFDCDLHCSYAPITPETPADKLKEDAFRMTDWHNKKATYIEDTPFSKPNNVKGILFSVDGPVASQLQFFVTDSLEKKHFLRAALYFNTQARPDSLAPVYDFVKKDIERMLGTFEWKN